MELLQTFFIHRVLVGVGHGQRDSNHLVLWPRVSVVVCTMPPAFVLKQFVNGEEDHEFT